MELNSQYRERAQAMQSKVLRAMDEISQRQIAALMSISESTLSKVKNDDMTRVLEVIALCGFRLVSLEEETFDARQIEAMRTLAEVGLKRVSAIRAG